MAWRVRSAKSKVADAAESRPVGWLARAGLTARGVVYILIGVLAVLLARGAAGKQIDQKGALAEVLSHSYGSALVAALAVGFFGYEAWRLSEALVGVTGEGKAAGPRLKSSLRGLAYLVLTFTAVSALRGSGQTQAGQQESLTARVLAYSGGRFVVAAAGLAVIAVGGAMVVEGVKLSFMRSLRAVPPELRASVVHLGRVGTIGRGLVFALIGVLLVTAAWTLDPHRAGGMDSAFRTLLAQPYGQVLGLGAALALVAFGVFGLAEARYRRV